MPGVYITDGDKKRVGINRTLAFDEAVENAGPPPAPADTPTTPFTGNTGVWGGWEWTLPPNTITVTATIQGFTGNNGSWDEWVGPQTGRASGVLAIIKVQ